MSPAVWPDTVSVCEEGTIARETSGSGVAGILTVIVATPVTTVPSGFEAVAVIAVVPFATAVATPLAELMVATETTLDFQVAALIVAVPIVAVWLVRFTVVPVDVVPITMSPTVWPAVVSVCDAGMMASETRGSVDPEILTVRVAIPVTTVPSGFVAVAVIAVVPLATAVATPVAELIVATDGTLELHAALLIVAVPIVAL